ncbi:MAG: glycosyltransferase family 61 protein [Alphaproteobacteria bacterium]|nr:glycosyltransferase family 61 protein [Alphaproteobacteria bacterium]
MLVRPIRKVIEDAVTIFASQLAEWPRVVAYSNYAAFCDHATTASFTKADDLTRLRVPEVFIGRYPPGATVLGADSFWVQVGQSLVLEQIFISSRLLRSFAPDPGAQAAALRAAVPDTADIEEECVLLARYGWGTWGHWLNEILCKAVVAEAAFPGRFRYVLPAAIAREGTERNFAGALIESLRAYGIAERREIRIEPSKNYRFRSLFDVGGCTMWARSGVILHPAVSHLMRERLSDAPARADSPLLAIERHGTTRTLVNAQEVNRELSANGFVFIDPLALGFREQMAYFRGAKTVFSVYGSGLANVLYSPPGIGALTCGPAYWGDTYFMYTVKERRGAYADVRGPPFWNGVGHLFHAPFWIDPAEVNRALAHLPVSKAQASVGE